MKPIFPSLPNGRVIFCDDIRSEIGNKTSLIGIYNGSIAFPVGITFPIALPKIGIAIFWHEPIENYSKHITFKVSYVPLDSDPYGEDVPSLMETHHNLEAMEKENPIPRVTPVMQAVMSRQFASYMILSPFNIPHVGKMRVRAYRDSDVRMVGAIAIEGSK